MVRNRERTAAGLCRQCAKPSELGQILCLAHRKVRPNSSRHSLPNPVRSALIAHRKQQEQQAGDRRAQIQREFIERHFHLIRDERSQKILKLRYGYTEAECQTLEQIGSRFGVTRERIRQIQQVAEETIYMLTIEKDIPIPAPTQTSEISKEVRETLLIMEVGDSFVLPFTNKQRNTIGHIARSMDRLITTRKIDDQLRVWLVSKQREAEEAA